MRSRIATLVLALGLYAGTADAGTLTFDDFVLAPGSSTPIPNGYQGFNWVNFEAFDPGPFAAGTGYENGTVSQENVALNAGGHPASFSAAGTFTLDSFYMSAAFRDDMTVRVLGRLNGNQVFSTSLEVDHTGPNLFVLNWSGINEVYFEASGGTPAGFESQTFQFAIDNLSVTTPVPEPGTLLLLGAGLAVAAVRLRRSRA